MGVIQAESIQETDNSEVHSIDDNLDTSRIYYFKHQNGEVASGTILDMDGCAFLGKAALKDRQMMAELYDMGQNILNEKKDEEETEELEAREEPGQGTELEEVSIKREPRTEKNEPSKTNSRKKETTEVNNSQEKDKSEISQASNSVFENNSASYTQGNQIESVPKAMSDVTGPREASQEIVSTKNREESAVIGHAHGKNETEEPITAQVAEHLQINSTYVDETEPIPNKVKIVANQVTTEHTPTDSNIEVFEETDGYISEDEMQITQSAVTEAVETELKEQGFNNIAGDEVSDDEWLSHDNYEPTEIIDLAASEGFITLNGHVRDFPMIEHGLENSEPTHELNLPIEEVEEAVTLVTERIVGLKDDQAEGIHQLLNQIARLSEEANSAPEGVFGYEGIDLKTEEVDEELKELFIQLFDQLEIEYTPNLVQAFVKIALNRGLPETNASQEEADHTNPLKEKGTHEAIKKLLVGISNFKRTILQALHLGKSAVHLYSLGLSQALEVAS